MANIYQIQQSLLDIFDVLEENGGELTPELEEQLAITEESFKDKVESYAKVISLYQDHLAAIKRETERLKKLKESKERLIERLSKIIIEAIENFGDEKPKTKVKYIDYGTGQVSIRKSQAVQLYDDNIKHIIECLNDVLDIETDNNQLDVIDSINEDAFIDRIASMPMGNCEVGLNVSKEDLDHVSLVLTTGFPLKDLFNGNAWTALREVIKNNPHYVLSSGINKTIIKAELKENGSCAPKIAKLVDNKNLVIK